MIDLIDRQALLKTLNENAIEFNADVNYFIMSAPSVQPEVTEEAVKDYCHKRCLTVLTNECFHSLTSAQPERKIGEWIKVDPHIMICPFCKKASSPKNFCADCGADMRGEENG